jgi:hypothetical protein
VAKCGEAGKDTDNNIIRSMRVACWITKATDTHSGYVIVTSFARQQWFRERASMLRYTSIASFVLLHLPYCLYPTATSRAMNQRAQLLDIHVINISLLSTNRRTSI